MPLHKIKFTKTAGSLEPASSGGDHVSGLVFYASPRKESCWPVPEIKPREAYPVRSLEELSGVFLSPRFLGEEKFQGEDFSPTAAVAYHVREFFRMSPGAVLWVCILHKPDGFRAVEELQTQTGGAIRQIAVHDELSDDIATAVPLLNQAAVRLDRQSMPLSVIYSPCRAPFSTELARLVKDSHCVSLSVGQSRSGYAKRLLDDERVVKLKARFSNGKAEAALGQIPLEEKQLLSAVKAYSCRGEQFHELEKTEINAQKKAVFTLKDKSAQLSGYFAFLDKKGQPLRKKLPEISLNVGCAGTLLGAVSAAGVNENIGWVNRFNLGKEFEEAELMHSHQMVDALSRGDRLKLEPCRVIYPVKYTGSKGTFFNDSHTLAEPENDLSCIENNRTIHKAIRGVRANLLPQLNGPL
ncbi:MAG: DUF2586 family protein, partial [Cytophagales bacterium]|nr:DUF2586 family protein [Cytophagales bacterium]